jgi:uncharacterized protein
LIPDKEEIKMVYQQHRAPFFLCLSSILLAALAVLSCGTGIPDSEISSAAGNKETVKWGHVELTEGPMNKVLLKDYSPSSSLVVPEHHPASASLPVIDVHTHVYAETPEEIREWVETMDRTGIDVTVVLTGATGEKFDLLTDLYLKAWPKRFQLFCGLSTENITNPEYPQKAAQELERCYGMGARGVGELVDKGWGYGTTEETRLPREERLHPNDPRLDLFWEKCAELELPVNLHIADHPSCWQPLGPEWERTPDFQVFNLYGKDVPSYEELISMRDNVLEKHRDTTFILCHFSNLGNNLDRLAGDLEKHDNLYLDISARDYEIGRQPRTAGEFLKKYRSRIMFGTDMGRGQQMYEGWWRLLETADEYIPGRQWWQMYGLALDRDTLQEIYRTTAENTLNWK